MESEGIYQYLFSIASAKTTEMYKKSIIILEQIKKTLEQQNQQKNATNGTAIFISIYSLITLSKKSQNYDYLDAQLFLLNKLMTKTNIAIIKKFCKDIASVIYQLFKVPAVSVMAGKYCIAILIQILQISSNEELLQNDNQTLLNEILQTIISENQVARKESYKGIKLLLDQKPLIKSQLSQQIKQFISDNISTKDEKLILYITQFISHIINVLSLEVLGDISQFLLKKLQTCDDLLKVHVYLVFENMMGSRPLTLDLSERLLKEFLNNQPSFYEDDKLVFAYGQCTIQTLLHINTFQPQIACKYIPSCLSMLQEIMLVDKPKLPSFAEKTMQLIIIHMIDKRLWMPGQQMNPFQEEDLDIDKLELESGGDNLFQKVIVMFKYMLSERFQSHQSQVLSVFSQFFEKINTDCISQLKELIIQFVQMRNIWDSVEWQKCFGQLVQSVGAEEIIKIFPISIQFDPKQSDFEEKSNLWLLMILNQYCSKQRFLTFMNYLVPLIRQITIYIQEKSDQIQQIQIKVLSNVQLKLYECLPKFTNLSSNPLQPIEQQALNVFLENVPTILNEELPYFVNILHGLINLIENSINNQTAVAVFHQHSQKLISMLAKLVQPGKCNNKLVLQLLQMLSSVAPKEQLEKNFVKNLQKIIQDQQNDLIKSNLSGSLRNFDIIIAIGGSLDLKDNKWYLSMQLVKSCLKEQNILQKKAYKYLLIIMKKIHYTFLPEVMDLLKQQENTINSSKFLRLSCLKEIWIRMKFDNLKLNNKKDISDQMEYFRQFMQNFLIEFVLEVRETNHRARKMAGEMLTIIAEFMKNQGQLKDYISMITAGLAGSSSLIQASSVEAIGFILEKFVEYVDLQFLNELKEIINLLLKENNKEIMKSVIIFYKKYTKNLSLEKIQIELPYIFSNIFSVKEEIRDNYKAQIKFFIGRFIKKYGQELVEQSMPKEHIKLAKAIAKEDRQKKKKQNQLKKERAKQQAEIKQKKANKNDNESGEDEAENQVKQDIMEEQFEETKQNANEDLNLLLKYDSENNQFHFVEHTVKKVKDQMKKQVDELNDVAYQNGKIVVKEETEEMTGKKRRREDKFESVQKLIKKDDQAAHSDQEEEKDAYNSSTKHNQKIKIKEKQDVHKEYVHILKESGETYKSKSQSGGDVKIAGKPDPYAFIQFNPKALNKRFKNKASKTFDLIMNKKHSGPLKGLMTKKVKTE